MPVSNTKFRRREEYVFNNKTCSYSKPVTDRHQTNPTNSETAENTILLLITQSHTHPNIGENSFIWQPFLKTSLYYSTAKSVQSRTNKKKCKMKFLKKKRVGRICNATNYRLQDNFFFFILSVRTHGVPIHTH